VQALRAKKAPRGAQCRHRRIVVGRDTRIPTRAYRPTRRCDTRIPTRANRPTRRCDTRFPCRGATCCARTACIAIYLIHNCLCGLFADGLSPGATGCAPTKVCAYCIVAGVGMRVSHRRVRRSARIASSPGSVCARVRKKSKKWRAAYFLLFAFSLFCGPAAKRFI
jgi:hypothetical protein